MRKTPCCATAAQVRAMAAAGTAGFECIGCGEWRIVNGKAVR